MTSPPKRTQNQKTRAYLDDLIKTCKPGSILFTEELSRALSIRFRSVTNRNVGLAMRERDDVELRNKDKFGTWAVK